MEFKKRPDGGYFPPVLPNGEFYGIALGGDFQQLLFTVNEDGLYAAGLHYLWSDITGISLTPNDGFRINSDKYRSGGLAFHPGMSFLKTADGERIARMNGYGVDYCLMNRITFESNGGELK
ncbi:hypothetical protein [Pseudomonas sp. 2FE]|uniref:hypothetical protein n=1 Tax=Pseudomonas sp. 2FE TaxID=2502190 RepID=UPI0010F4A063|nr:hypothetical protein [Pseudomonas sp. 2FE]